MKLASFSLLVALSIIYFGLTLAETAMYQTWDHALNEQKDIQRKVAYFQKLNGFIEQLLRRMAVDSQRDPALAELLKENRIKVVVTSAEPMADAAGAGATPAAAAAATPAAQNAPASAPTSTHP